MPQGAVMVPQGSPAPRRGETPSSQAAAVGAETGQGVEAVSIVSSGEFEQVGAADALMFTLIVWPGMKLRLLMGMGEGAEDSNRYVLPPL